MGSNYSSSGFREDDAIDIVIKRISARLWRSSDGIINTGDETVYKLDERLCLHQLDFKESDKP